MIIVSGFKVGTAYKNEYGSYTLIRIILDKPTTGDPVMCGLTENRTGCQTIHTFYEDGKMFGPYSKRYNLDIMSGVKFDDEEHWNNFVADKATKYKIENGSLV